MDRHQKDWEEFIERVKRTGAGEYGTKYFMCLKHEHWKMLWAAEHIEELEAENKALREFICHHGGLINEWASEYIEHKLDFWLEEK